MNAAVILVSHGTVENLDDLTAFVTNVRRGHAPPASLIAELRRRYEAIGGSSPLNAICSQVAVKLAARLGVRVATANRLWHPYTADVLSALADEGVSRVGLVALAQHSSAIYSADARRAPAAARVELKCADDWGQLPALHAAFASRIAFALHGAEDMDRTIVLMTAHSLPKAVVLAGDPYEREVRASAVAVAAELASRMDPAPHTELAFQSQGFAARGPDGRPMPWLGPDLPTSLDACLARGARRVLFAPIGFLADHVEVLYDLDIEARALCDARGLRYQRAASLNSDNDFIEVLAHVARPLVAAETSDS